MNEYTKNLIENNINYITDQKYTSGRIIEYDIKSANISILKVKNQITDSEYLEYSNMPKYYREREIGLKIRDNANIYDTIKNGIIEYKLKFVESNNIDGNDIIRIANDSILVNSFIDPIYTVFDNIVTFVRKAIYNVVLSLSIDSSKSKSYVFLIRFEDNGNIIIDTKGIGDKSYLFNDFLSIIATTVFYMERVSIQDAAKYISNIVDKYINLQLPISYYREFNADAKYRVISNNEVYIVDDISNINNIDIGYNFALLSDLWKIVLHNYNQQYKPYKKKR